MKRSILLLEENRSLRYLISTLFIDKYLVRSAENSQEAMNLFNSGYEPDLIILDIVDAESENLELLEHFSTSSSFRDVPVVVLSSSTNEKLKNTCLESGANVFLNKPFNPVYLVEKADRLLSRDALGITNKRKGILSGLNIF